MSNSKRSIQHASSPVDGEFTDALHVAEVQTEAVFCSQCGTANRPTAHYCRKCGRAIDDDTSLDHLQMPVSRKTKHNLADPSETSTRHGPRPITMQAVILEVLTTAIMGAIFMLVMSQNAWLALAVLVAWMSIVIVRWTSN